jgi:hypothetical protein
MTQRRILSCEADEGQQEVIDHLETWQAATREELLELDGMNDHKLRSMLRHTWLTKYDFEKTSLYCLGPRSQRHLGQNRHPKSPQELKRNHIEKQVIQQLLQQDFSQPERISRKAFSILDPDEQERILVVSIEDNEATIKSYSRKFDKRVMLIFSAIPGFLGGLLAKGADIRQLETQGHL